MTITSRNDGFRLAHVDHKLSYLQRLHDCIITTMKLLPPEQQVEVIQLMKLGKEQKDGKVRNDLYGEESNQWPR